MDGGRKMEREIYIIALYVGSSAGGSVAERERGGGGLLRSGVIRAHRSLEALMANMIKLCYYLYTYSCNFGHHPGYAL